MSSRSEYISIRVNAGLKDELSKAARLEHRSLSNTCRLLLEYAWDEYLKAGSLKQLLDSTEKEAVKTIK